MNLERLADNISIGRMQAANNQILAEANRRIDNCNRTINSQNAEIERLRAELKQMKEDALIAEALSVSRLKVRDKLIEELKLVAPTNYYVSPTGAKYADGDAEYGYNKYQSAAYNIFCKQHNLDISAAEAK